MPKITFQAQGNASDDCWHVVLISLLRGVAAIEVAAAHLRADMYPSLRTVADPPLWFQGFAFLTGFAHHAVLVFFVISGWLVGGSLLDKRTQPAAIANYAIDRVTRLWTVLVPTFAMTLLIGLGIGDVGTVSMEGLVFSPDNAYSALVFGANLIGLQTIVLPTYGGNFPLWSLANETWYYLMFALLVAMLGARGRAARMASGAALLVLVMALPAALLGYFAVWLLGVAFSRVTITCGPALRWCTLLLVAAMWGYYRLTGDMNTFALATLLPDMLCSVAFLVLLCSLRFKAGAASTLLRPLARWGNFFAAFSFSLYVLHVPLIGLLRYWSARHWGLDQLAPERPLHFLLYLAMLATLLAASYLSYLLFEAQTGRVRRWLKRALLGQIAVPAAAPLPAD
jgi:peptidoglycan/LPS O-acetylase OafA/YrhL